MVTIVAWAWLVVGLFPAGFLAVSQAPPQPAEMEDCESDLSLLQVGLDFYGASRASAKGSIAASRAASTGAASGSGTGAGVDTKLVAAFSDLDDEASECEAFPGLWAVAISPQGERMASGSCDKMVRVYDLTRPPSEALLATLMDATDHVSSVTFWEDEVHGLILGAADLEGTWRLYNATPGVQVPHLLTTQHEGSPLEGIAISRDTPLMATATSGGTVRLWKIDPPGAPEMVQEVLSAGEDHATSVALTPLGHRLGVGLDDGNLKVWSTNKSGLFLRDEVALGHHLNNVVFSRSNDLLAVASWDGSVRIYGNIFPPGESMQLLSTIWDGSSIWVNSVSFNHDETLLAACYSDGKAQIYDITDVTAPQLRVTFNDNEGPIHSVVFGDVSGSDGARELLATAGSDGTVRLYHLHIQ